MNAWWTLLVVLLVMGCAYPGSRTQTVDDSAMLVIEGAQENALLVVDGIEVGPAADYSGKKALAVRPGRHVVEVRDGEKLLLKQEIFVGTGVTKTLQVGSSGG